MTDVVLDASAILAVVKSEAGAEQVKAPARSSLVSAVNHAEALSRLVRDGRDIRQARMMCGRLSYAIIEFDEPQAIECGRLQRFTHHLRLSLSDRACLALAKLRGLEVLTADRAWTKLSIGVTIRAIR